MALGSSHKDADLYIVDHGRNSGEKIELSARDQSDEAQSDEAQSDGPNQQRVFEVYSELLHCGS